MNSAIKTSSRVPIEMVFVALECILLKGYFHMLILFITGKQILRFFDILKIFNILNISTYLSFKKNFNILEK